MDEKFYSNVNILDSIEKDGFKVEILECNHLKGSKDAALAEDLFYIKNAGMSLKMVKVTLENSGLITESGALYFHKGNIECTSGMGGVGGLAKKLIKSKLTNESTFKPVYKGTGEIFLEPSFSHYVLMHLENESIVVDKGIFYCCEEGMEIGVASQKNLSSGLLGGEGWFQTQISGTGAVVLEIPIPMEEVLKYKLDNERIQVDGNFALLRSGSVAYSVQRSSKQLFGSMTSGEGLLQTFEGTGQVWLAPTQPVYNRLKHNGIPQLATAGKNIDNSI
ncbi:AIM24 family protein [Methanosarcina acetivorans]|uniref:HTH DNA-binding protein n=1 Tax=Methanosarcina acetivorans (strain ATCC 35395 / DSM 2834 / JCM 12185 / C2A) TaxID=188937 RepID=Q8TMN8_METAC|nr:AIM24 family protein [Methanosarcina acetivorans]AAM05996.1 conserved hypothetical protein [Methanosarcina acetivorans C2A]